MARSRIQPFVDSSRADADASGSGRRSSSARVPAYNGTPASGHSITVTASPSSATALFTASVACDSDTPGARLKLMLLAGVPRSWLTDSGVLVVVMRANAVSGICCPWLLTKKKPRSVSGFCR